MKINLGDIWGNVELFSLDTWEKWVRKLGEKADLDLKLYTSAYSQELIVPSRSMGLIESTDSNNNKCNTKSIY